MQLNDHTVCSLIDTLSRTASTLDKLTKRLDRVSRFLEESETWQALECGIWISNSDPTRPWDKDFVDNTDIGMIEALQKAGQAATTLGTKARATSPYSTELMPVASLQGIYDAQRVKLFRLWCGAIDTTLVGGGTGQDAATIANMMATLTTDRAYMQSLYRYGQIVTWQPNWFRPQMYVNKSPVIYPGLADSEVSSGHLGHLSIGLPQPWFTEPNIHLGKLPPDSLSVYAQAAQYEGAAAKFQRYAVMVVAEFLVGGSLPGSEE